MNPEAAAAASRAVAAAELHRRLRTAIARFRRRSRSDAASSATESLANWAARCVDWYQAHRGWLYLHDPVRKVLNSVPGTAVRTPHRDIEISDSNANSIVAHVWRSGNEYVSNDVLRDQREGRPYFLLDPATKAEMAVPIIDIESEEAVGVFNLEANGVGAFTNSQARELRRSAALFAYPALVLDSLRTAAGEKSYGWNPEVHGWNPGRMVQRFCHAAAAALDPAAGLAPSCVVWYRDPDNGRVWALAAAGYDFDFLNLYSLDEGSAVARAAALAPGDLLRGSPAELGFQARRKASRHGVTTAILAPLRAAVAGGEPFRGALAIYSFGVDTPLPSDAAVRWLARQAEQLIAAVYGRRGRFAQAFVVSRLGRSAFVRPCFQQFRKALTAVLPNDAVSIYGRAPDAEVLVGIDAAACDSGSSPRAPVPIRASGPQASITAHCAVRPGRALRINFGAADPVYQRPDPPPPPRPTSVWEMELGDAHYYRRLGVGVPAADESGHRALGVIRVYRSGQSAPFTHLDGGLLEQVGGAYPTCKSLFAAWRLSGNDWRFGPTVLGPTSALLAGALWRAVDAFGRAGRAVYQGAVFEHSAGAVPEYRRIAYYSPVHQLPPDERLDPLPEDVIGRTVWEQARALTVSSGAGGGQRACLPILVWSGRSLVDAVCCLDFERPTPWDAASCGHVYALGVEAAAMLAVNRWASPPRALDDENLPLTSAFMQYVRGQEEVARARLWPTHDAAPDHFARTAVAEHAELGRYGVRVRADRRWCIIPLYLGPYRAGAVECEFKPEKSARFLSQARGPSTGQDVDLLLRSFVGRVTGAWLRVVAPNTKLWSVTFKPGTEGESGCVWGHNILGPTVGELADDVPGVRVETPAGAAAQ